MGNGGSRASTYGGFSGTTATILAALGGGLAAAVQKAAKRRRPSMQRQCFFGSSGSGFLGSSQTAFSVTPEVQDTSSRNGAAGLNMKGTVWWITNNGFDGRGGKIFDSRRRESRRRGEELFRHDVDNFELTLRNLIRAPGQRKFKVRRGR